MNNLFRVHLCALIPGKDVLFPVIEFLYGDRCFSMLSPAWAMGINSFHIDNSLTSLSRGAGAKFSECVCDAWFSGST